MPGGVVFKDVFNIDYVTFWGYNIDFFWISAIGLVIITGLYTTFGGHEGRSVHLCAANTNSAYWLHSHSGTGSD
jgi:hypothetical protein